MPERCLAKLMGSCRGCKVQDEASLEMRRNGREPNDVLKLLSQEKCPDGLRVQMPEKEKSIFFVK